MQLAAVSIGTMQLAAVSIGTMQLADVSIGTMQLAAVSIGTMQLAAVSIGTMQLAAVSILHCLAFRNTNSEQYQGEREERNPMRHEFPIYRSDAGAGQRVTQACK
jgi:hypothetical protein